MSSASIVESSCQSFGIVGVPQPRCSRSRGDAFGIHSSQRSSQPSKPMSTSRPAACFTCAGYHNSSSSFASSHASTVSEAGRWTDSSDSSLVCAFCTFLLFGFNGESARSLRFAGKCEESCVGAISD